MTRSAHHAGCRALIVDDERIARAGLRAMLALEPAITVVGEAATVVAGAAAIRELRPDIVFLDIQLPDHDGFRLLSVIPATQRPTVVFVTAHARYALPAFDVSAVDYLLKPFDRPRLSQAVERAVRDVHSRSVEAVQAGRESAMACRTFPTRLLVRDRDVASFVSLSDVEWIEVYGNYCRLFINGRPRLVRKTMNALAAQLEPARFLRISRSIIVNLQHVSRIRHRDNGQAELLLPGGMLVRSSRRFRVQLRSALRELG
ncbi:MAG: LytTr DNA-binding region [Gemmatimonadetes bacterium]|nr:LytTr DNA-binding region [Gemmatimonadota bacterium]